MSMIGVAIFDMSLSKSVEDSLRDAESNLRNALAFAARQELSLIHI